MNNKRTILYVDDEALNLMLFKINLQDQFNIITAESGLEGLGILEQNPDIEIVFSDMKMPGMNGIEFIRTAKNRFPNVLYYMLTGYDITDEINTAINEKLIVSYFTKPFDIKSIISSINNC